MTAPAIAGLAYAYANRGRWVCDCPRPWCSNAMQVWPGQDTFACLGRDSCGWTCPIVWPPDPAAIETLLSARPAPATRNWRPGEALTDLLRENAEYLLIPDEWVTPGDHAPLLYAENEVVISGTILPAVLERRQKHEIERDVRALADSLGD